MYSPPPLGLDAVFRGRREIDDRIDPIGRGTEFERQIHIAAAERVDEGIGFASGCGADPIRDAFHKRLGSHRAQRARYGLLRWRDR